MNTMRNLSIVLSMLLLVTAVAVVAMQWERVTCVAAGWSLGIWMTIAATLIARARKHGGT